MLPLYRKPKRIRTAFNPNQLLKLEEAFEKNQYVVGAERKQLAASLNLTETQVRDGCPPRRRQMNFQVQGVYVCELPGVHLRANESTSLNTEVCCYLTKNAFSPPAKQNRSKCGSRTGGRSTSARRTRTAATRGSPTARLWIGATPASATVTQRTRRKRSWIRSEPVPRFKRAPTGVHTAVTVTLMLI